MPYTAIQELDLIKENKLRIIDKINEKLGKDSGLTWDSSWEDIKLKIDEIQTFLPVENTEVFSEIENLLTNTNLDNIKIWSNKIIDRLFNEKTNLKSIIAPNATNIGQYSFCNCTGLTTIELQKLCTISVNAFFGCTNLENINFSKIITINTNGFYNCTKIHDINLENCTSIGESAFNGCTKLGPVLYLNNTGYIYANAFSNCSNIEEVIITDTDKILYNNALSNINNNIKWILCETANKPASWDVNWNSSSYPVYWNAKVKDWTFVYNNEKPNTSLTTRIIDEFPDEGTKEGYVFDCWCTDSSLEIKCELPYTSPEASPVLYAKWLIGANIHTYNTETGEWSNYGIYHISQLSDIQTLKINVTVDELYMDAEFTIPLTDISQITPNCDIYIIGVTRMLYELDYTGEVDSIILQPGTYKLECWGAQGGYRSTSYVNMAGKGAYSAGCITLNATTTIYAYVGGSGNTGGTAGGFNGGGSRDTHVGGGGASDIRIGTDSLYARVIVAGGGGSCGSPSYFGGYGGGSVGQDANSGYGTVGYGGTQINSPQGGGESRNNGSFGHGGYGSYRANGYGGAGGGGWYGGTGCYPDGSADDDKGGGGGSGWIYTEAAYMNWAQNSSEGQSGQWLLNSDYYLADAYLKAGNETFLDPEGIEETGHSGNGYIRITSIRSD